MTTKEIIGKVISNKMNKTLTVTVLKKIAHKKYDKIISKTNKYYVHDENNDFNIGDIIKIQAVRPMSKQKRWKAIKKINK